MTDIVSIITDNLVWILVGIVVILLAIIGRYADQTNFGEGKKIIKVKKKSPKRDIIDKLAIEQEEPEKDSTKEMNTDNSSEKKEEVDIIEEMKKNTRDNFNPDADTTSVLDQNIQTEEIKEQKKKESEEMSSDEFLKTDDLDILLPKKNVVTGDFLQEVEDINLDFKKKDLLSDIPDLDDVDLPSIRKKKGKTDIWG